jgi:hypothetical protein
VPILSLSVVTMEGISIPHKHLSFSGASIYSRVCVWGLSQSQRQSADQFRNARNVAP